MTENMNIVFVGHVDHGKSTIIGRMLADTESLPEGKLQQVQETCRRNSKPFEYAFLLDALKEEQSQGITIDAARCFFKTPKREYIIIDAPGHIEFLKNMVTGAARAEAAVLIIDAKEGVRENSRRHGYLLSMLGIKQVAVLINKMDLVDFQQKTFTKIQKEYSAFLKKIGITASSFIPVSGMKGDNIVNKSDIMTWHKGNTLLEILDQFENSKEMLKKPFRMPVQSIYKFTANGDNRRIIAGTIATGSIAVNDEILFYPSGKTGKIKTIEEFPNKKYSSRSAGYSCGFTLEEQILVQRGDVAVKKGEPKPCVSSKIKANIFWLGKKPLVKNKEYYLKLGTAKVKFHVEEIIKTLDASTLQDMQKNKLERNDVGELVIKLNKAITFELVDNMPSLGRFVIIDNYEICGGGIITNSMTDGQQELRDKVLIRNYKWAGSSISLENRMVKYSQKPRLILITGDKNTGKKTIARALEKRLFDDGRIVTFLGIGSIIYGVDADLTHKTALNKEEHLRRLAEIAHIFLSTSGILIVTAINLSQSDLEIISTIIEPDKIDVILIGTSSTSNIQFNLHIPEIDSVDIHVGNIKKMLSENGVIFSP